VILISDDGMTAEPAWSLQHIREHVRGLRELIGERVEVHLLVGAFATGRREEEASEGAYHSKKGAVHRSSW
jgi:hypothetical protein